MNNMHRLGVLSELILRLYGACRDMAVDRYQLWALDQVKARIPFDAALWASGVHMESLGPVIYSVTSVNRPLVMLQDYEAIKHADFLAKENAANFGRACAVNAMPDHPASTPEIRAYLTKWRIANAMCCWVVDPLTRLTTAIAIYREDRAAPFLGWERQLFEELMPHMIETYATCRILHMVRATQSRSTATHASAVSDREGRLHAAPAPFQDKLLAEWPDWRGNLLPAELQDLARGAAAGRFVGHAVFFRCVPMENLVLLQARDKCTADELTVRELEIARLASKGLIHRKVAEHLKLSTATVRNHLSAAYDKLGVRKQSELVPLLRELD